MDEETTAQSQASPKTKKGLGPLTWVLIGCFGLLVLGMIGAFVGGIFIFDKAKDVLGEFEENPVVASAKLIAAANPEIEFVSSDEDGRTVTFRDTRTQKEFTFNYQDIEEGKVQFSSPYESVSVDIETDQEDEGKVTITTKEGTTTFGAGRGVAAEFPDWVPVYPGTTPEGTYSTDSAQVRSGAYTITLKDSLEEIVNYYVAAIKKAGLEIKNRTTVPTGVFLIANSPDDSRMVSFTEKKN